MTRRISRLLPAATLAALFVSFVLAGVSGCVEPDEGSPPDTPAADTTVPSDEGAIDTSEEDAPPTSETMGPDVAPDDDTDTIFDPCPPPEAPLEGTQLSCIKDNDCMVVWALEQEEVSDPIDCRAYCSEWVGSFPPLEWASPDYVNEACDW